MKQEDMLIVTTHPEFSDAGFNELQQFDQKLTFVAQLASGITLYETPHVEKLMQMAAERQPIFVRHLAPVQTIVTLNNSEQDIGTLAVTVAELPTFSQLERGQYFAVQTRLIQPEEFTIQRPYTSGQINRSLAEAISEETGAIESVRKPRIVVSLLCLAEKAYIGISIALENLSDWPGGARHYAQTPEQISRAEFKLLEALEVFGVQLPSQGRVLDLGAAPGGWTRLLLEAGLSVVAVDPANLDPRLNGRPHLEHYRGYAEAYLEEAVKKHRRFDLIVNDMRMDAREAARLLGHAATCLRPEGFIISVLKLPHENFEIRPLVTLNEAIRILKQFYAIVHARQLFHNRQEVTIIAAQPLSRHV